MFVVKAIGASMEPLIHNGDYCVFRANPAGSREGKVLLVQHHTGFDPEYGGSFAIKKYSSEKIFDIYGHWSHATIKLLPLNPSYNPIVLQEEDANEFRVIGEFIGIVKGQ